MSLTFPKVNPVVKGQVITSTQWNALAESFNVRIRAGFDWAWRTNKYFENWARQFRNPSEDGFLFPAQGEWFYLHMLIDADKQIQAPVAGPGEPEGANLANPMNQIVFGNPSLTQEDVRLSDEFPLWLGSGAPTTITDYWEIGKIQRGAITSGGPQSTPALNAALSWLKIGNAYYSPHGKGYGGKFASALRIRDTCDSDPSAAAYNVPSVQIKFTNTITGAVVTYAGTCPRNSEFGGAGNVLNIGRLPIGSVVYVDNGIGGTTEDFFSAPEWIEGPYTGTPILSHTDGEHVGRVLLNSFIKDFRGTSAQRTPDTFKIEDIAFDYQAFLTKQYPLAPNFGLVVEGGIQPQYPTAILSTTAAAGSFIAFSPIGATFTYQAGYICAAIFAKSTNLAAACALTLIDEAGATIGSLTLQAGAKSDAMLWLSEPKTPVNVRCRLDTAAIFSGIGSIQFETTQLLPYKPQYWDGYLVNRMSSTRGGFDIGPQDGNGTEQTDSKEIYQSLAQKGCVLNRHGVAGPMQIENNITSNPGYDAARRFVRDCMRIVPRQSVLSYEVTGGKSVLRFRRYAFGASDDLKADMFYGIAPPYAPVTELIPEEKYIVRGTGSVLTSAGVLTDGQIFTAVSGHLSFTITGDAALFIYEGIRPVARPKGLTNEWVMYRESHAYHPSDSSIWKPDAYADYFTGINGCHFQSATIALDSPLAAHINYTPRPLVTLSGGSYLTSLTDERVQSEFVNPEAPTGFNFEDDSNASFHFEPRIQFYKACQIYRVPYVVESAVVEIVGGFETVKITLATRLRAHESAPASVNVDPATWSDEEIFDLRVTEDYRTCDNSLREYFLLQQRGTHATFKTGDAGADSSIRSQPDNPFGAVFPTFFFVKELEKVREDANDTVQLATDTRRMMDLAQRAEMLIRTGCEGFVDSYSTEKLACGSGGLYNYSLQTLCFHGFGGSCFSPIDPAVRADVAGFSALPNTEPYATLYNQLAACLNLLTKARISLPMRLKIISDNYRTNYSVAPTMQYPGPPCEPGDNSWAFYEGGPIAPDFVETVGPVFNLSAGASSSGFFGGFPFCADSTQWNFASTKSVVHYSAEMIDEDALNAIPDPLKDLIVNKSTGFLALYTETVETVTKTTVGTLADSEPCCTSTELSEGSCSGFIFDGVIGYRLHPELTYIAGSPDGGGECRLINSGTLDPGVAPTTLYATAHRTVGAEVHQCSWGGSHTIGFGAIGSSLLTYFSVPLV